MDSALVVQLNLITAHVVSNDQQRARERLREQDFRSEQRASSDIYETSRADVKSSTRAEDLNHPPYVRQPTFLVKFLNAIPYDQQTRP